MVSRPLVPPAEFEIMAKRPVLNARNGMPYGFQVLAWLKSHGLAAPCTVAVSLKKGKRKVIRKMKISCIHIVKFEEDFYLQAEYTISGS